MKNKKKLIIVGSIIASIIVAIVIAVTVLSIIKNKNQNSTINTNNEEVSNQAVPEVKITGKLLEYVNSLTDNYYIKYSGKFKDESGKLVESIVDFTKDKEDFAIKMDNINMHFVYEQGKLYSVSYSYKTIVQMAKESFPIDEYNLASDIGQTFVKEYEEKVNNNSYSVEEYKYRENTLKYYFKDGTLKFIRYNDNEIKVIRLELQTNEELFQMPTNYTKLKA